MASRTSPPGVARPEDRARPFVRPLLAIAAAGAALRLVYVLVLARKVPDIGDAGFFHHQALELAKGHGFVDPFVSATVHHPVASAAHPPLYPLVVSVVARLGGTSEVAQRSLGALFGFGTIVLIGLIARRIDGRRTGLVAATVAAIYPVLVAADGAMMSETLYGLLIAGALLLSLNILGGRRTVPAAAGLGALIGLAALTRAEGLLLLALLAWPLALYRPPRRVALLAASTLACAVVLAPWLIRNLDTFHELTMSHNDATVLAGANCPAAYHGTDLGTWNFACISKRRTFNERVQSDRWRSEGFRYLRHHAGRLVVVVPIRVMRTWDLWQPRRQVEFAESEARWASKAGVVVYFLLIPFAVAGAWLVRRPRGPLMVLLAPVALVTFVSAVGYGVPRFRHPAEIAIVALSAVAIGRVPAAVRSGRSPRSRSRTSASARSPRGAA